MYGEKTIENMETIQALEAVDPVMYRLFLDQWTFQQSALSSAVTKPSVARMLNDSYGITHQIQEEFNFNSLGRFNQPKLSED